MSLLGNIANKEIFNFLKTTTIKNSYFAKQSKSRHIRANIADRVPDNEIPYYKHVAGTYILKDPVTVSVKNPKTGIAYPQTYSNTSLILNSRGEQVNEIKNTLIYEDAEGVFDEMMYVTSLDTQEEIPFTLENLHPEYALEEGLTHTKTLEAYKLPSRYYELLCERYPKQVDLIKAIVYPVKKARDITVSERQAYAYNSTPLPTITRRRIDALIEEPNYSVLSYDTSVLDATERHDIVREMEELVNIIKTRWSIDEYTYEENYAVVLWTMMWSILPLGLIAQRFSNIKTPFAHSSHIWDYLISKGLESYKGYLSDAQTQFLYKNINYILENRGQQQITNLLIDELLSEAGLNIKCKTIVLDTTNSLNTRHLYEPPNVRLQCSTCGRRTKCHRNISDWQCPDYIGVTGVCQPEPIVLTEEFAGANKEKILDGLTSQYGYTKEKALEKYKRSLLWKDAEVEDIRSSLDRDQLTDLDGETDTLENLIRDEYNSGLEPVFNDSIVEQQTNELRHIEGTVAPTKILEITRNTYNARFANLFNKFLTETLLHLAPKDTTSDPVAKCTCMYNVVLGDEATSYNMSFGEVMALLYLGETRENYVELFFDHCNSDEVFTEGVTYFRRTISDDADQGKIEADNWANGNRMIMLDVSAKIGKPIGADDKVYRWAPKMVGGMDPGKFLPAIEGHEVITNFAANRTYDFPIPDQIQLRNAFKFGKPVKQEDLLDAWYNDSGSDNVYLNIMPSEARKALRINGLVYAVKVAFTLSTDAGFVPGKTYYESNYKKDQYVVTGDTSFIKGKDYYECDLTDKELAEWDWSPIKLRILGIVKNEAYFNNDDEIPVIPRYCRWYSNHLKPDTSTMGLSRSVKVIYDLPFDSDAEQTTARVVDERYIYDPDKGREYQLVEIGRYVDLDGLIANYMDLMENVTEQAQVGAYIGTMFSIYEQLHTFVSKSSSIRVNLAAQAFFDAARCNKKYRVNLTNTSRTSTWPREDSTEYEQETPSCKVAYYDDWFKFNKLLADGIVKVDSSDDWCDTWSAINKNIIDKLLTGCTSAYWESMNDNTIVRKLRDLVTHLSSYKVNFIDVESDSKIGDGATDIVSDNAEESVTTVDRVYIDPIMDVPCNPHSGELFTSTSGEMYAYTRDTHAVTDKIYYRLVASHSTSEYVTLREIPLDMDVYVFEEAAVNVGDELDPYTYFECANLYTLLGISSEYKIEVSKHGHDWYYRTGKLTTELAQVSASKVDTEIDGVYDTFLDMSHITTEVRKKLKCALYRKYVDKNTYAWGEYIKSDLIKDLFSAHVVPTYVADKHVLSSNVIDSNHEKLTVRIETQSGLSKYVYKSGVLAEEYVFDTSPTGEQTGPTSGGYMNRYGCVTSCDCGRSGPQAGVEFLQRVPIWDPSLRQENGAYGNFQLEYWIDPVSGEKMDMKDHPIYRFEVDTSTGKLRHHDSGHAVGDICPFCSTVVQSIVK